MTDQAAVEAVRARLAALHAEVSSGHPELYQHLALYLQVLRDRLLQAVRQAAFHLATQVHPQRYAALPAGRRRALQRRLQALVRRSCCLLTVEQLAHLAGELDRERLEQQQERQQRLLEALEQRHRLQGETGAPQGSVNLGLSLPIGPELVDGDSLASLLPAQEERDAAPMPRSTPADATEREALQARRAVAAMAEALTEVLGSATADAATGGEDRDSLLPAEPMLLLRWLAGYEQALVRRLRNLSHAINVELLRQGVSNALLPITLLEAVIQGQVEVMPAPANLLHLPLPFPSEGEGASAGGLEAYALLLRPADLELEIPPLRTCRQRLQQALQQMRRMAHESARLQRRLATLEAEQLWLQDINAATRPAT